MKKLMVFVALITLTIMIGSCGLSDDTVAKVGNQEITKAEFLLALQAKYPEKSSFEDVDSLAKMNVLNAMLEKRRKLADAYDLGLDEDENLQKQVARQRETIISSKYFEHAIVDQLLPDEKLREYFEKSQNEYKASHILIGFAGPHNPDLQRSRSEAQKLADEVYKKVQAGADFTKLVIKYSDDPSKNRNKGDLGYFGAGRMVPSFEQAVMSMQVGEISKPVESQFGFHIIRLDDKRPNKGMANRTFESEYMKIKHTMYRSVAQKGNQMWQKHSDSLKTTINLTFNDENVQKIVDTINQLRADNKNKLELNMLTNNETDLILANWNGGEYSFGQLIEDYGSNLNRIQHQLGRVDQVKQMAERRIMQLVTINIALQRGYDREKDVIEDLKNFKESRMLGLLQKAQIDDKIEISDEEKLKYYEEHKEIFVIKPQIEIWEIQVNKESEAKKILKLAQSGKDFVELAKKYSVDKVFGKKGGYVGYKEEQHRGVISREAMKAGPESYAGPVKYRNKWVIIKTGKLKEKQYKSYEESESRIVSLLKKNLKNERTKAWQNELIENYPVKFNQNLIMSI